MKVICINDVPTGKNILITKGKVYDVINLTLLNDYVIICDNGETNSMGRARFITLEEYRDQQINKLI
jgi:hypothetical protein